MPNIDNINKLAAIEEDVKAATAIWVVDYRGLTVKQSEALRHRVTAAGGEMKIYKNTLTKIALENAGLPQIDDVLAGPSAFVFCGGQFVEAAKALKEFTKEADGKLVIKGGLLEGEAMTAEQVLAIADMPPKEALIGQIAGLISGMARGLAVSISGVSRGVALATKAVSEQKSAA